MLAHALRRLLWTIPALIGVSLFTFFFLSYVPDPTDDPAFAASVSPAELERLRRERFLDLPRFVNLAPHDVRGRADEVVAAIERGGPDADEARRELVRLGGAALPWVLPRLDALSPEKRKDLALALAPIAERMGLAGRSEAQDPARALNFWTRFWDDRGIEFRHASVRSALSRLARYGSASRASDLLELDTFVLDDVLGTLEPLRDEDGISSARARVEVAAHVTGRDDRIAPGASLAGARACVDRWQSFWTVYRSDFTADAGVGRVAAMVLETRYGKWAYEAVTHRFGRAVHVGRPADPGGRGSASRADAEPAASWTASAPVLDELAARVPTTLRIVLGAIALAYALAVPLGAMAAAYRGRRVNVVVTLAVLALYATPTAAVAVLVRRAGGGGELAAIAVLALALLAAPTAQQSASLSLSLSSEYVRAALARGASRRRAVFVHALRHALLPVGTLATLEGPMALGGAFVVERVFSLHGVGEATIVAVQQRDTGWLMAISMIAALIAAVVVVAGDLAAIAIDPRLGPALLARRGRA